MQTNNKPITKILAVRNDRFGEFLLNIPAFNALKKMYPKAKLTVVLSQATKELVAFIPSIDETIIWEHKKHTTKEILSFSKKLRKEKFDLCVILNPTKEFHIISFLSKIPVRIGYSKKCGFLLSNTIEDKKYLGAKHEIEYNLELAGLAKKLIPPADKSLKIEITKGFQDKTLDKFGLDHKKPAIAIHPWTSDQVKQWPLRNFKELALKLSQESDRKIIIVGGKEEQLKSKALFAHDSTRIINLTGKTSLLELSAVLKGCALLISGDSGPVHLACAVETKTIVLFRNDLQGKTPSRWGPWGKGHIVIEKSNLRDITTEEVFIKAKEILRGKEEK